LAAGAARAALSPGGGKFQRIKEAAEEKQLKKRGGARWSPAHRRRPGLPLLRRPRRCRGRMAAAPDFGAAAKSWAAEGECAFRLPAGSHGGAAYAAAARRPAESVCHAGIAAALFCRLPRRAGGRFAGPGPRSASAKTAKLWL